MKGFKELAFLSAAVILVSASTGAIAAKKKSSPKKPTAKTTSHATLGTTQLKGEYAEFGNTYTLGKENPMNITLKSAEYTVEPVTIGDRTYIPNAENKFLVLHMTYHNPKQAEQFIRWDTYGFTVVDPEGQNHDDLKDLGMEKDNKVADMNLKPAQKVEVFGLMEVPAAREMPKLIIKSSDETVLRYDLRNKVKAIPAPYADPKDKTGATALSTIPAQMGTLYTLAGFSVKVDSAEYSTQTQFKDYSVDEGERFLVIGMTVKNLTAGENFLRWDTFQSQIQDADGVSLADCTDMFQKSRDSSFNMNLKPAQEVQVRCLFKIPTDAQPKVLSMRYDEGRTFLFDISSVK